MTDLEKAARAVLDTRVDFGGDKHPITDGALVARTALDALRAALDSEQGDGWELVKEYAVPHKGWNPGGMNDVGHEYRIYKRPLPPPPEDE